MLLTVAQIESRFRNTPELDPDYLIALRAQGQTEQLAHLDFYLSGADPIWLGSARNIGANVIKVRNPSAFRRILPSYMTACILVNEKGPSAAENTDMPFLLAERLCPPLQRGLFDGYEPGQLATIARVLALLAIRHDRAGASASAAISGYWFNFAES